MKTHEKIKLLREAQNWTQEDMAEKMGMSPSGYAKIERGGTKMNLPQLEKIADILGIGLLELLRSSESNLVCHISEGDNNQGHNYYSGSQDLIVEVEKLKLSLQHKSELLDQKDRIIARLEEQIETQKNLLSLLQTKPE